MAILPLATPNILTRLGRPLVSLLSRFCSIFARIEQASALIFSILGLLILIRYAANTASDPSLCRAMLEGGGRWLDPARAYVDGRFQKWQPPGCLFRTYDWDELAAALSGSRLLFIGDSTTRNPYDSFVKIRDPKYSVEKDWHSHNLTLPGLEVLQEFDPLLNHTKTVDEIAAFRANATGTSSIPRAAELIFISVGLWQVRWLDNNGTTEFGRALRDLLDPVPPKTNSSAVVSLSSSTTEAPAHRDLIFSPVQIPSQQNRIDWYIDGHSEGLNDMLRRQYKPPGVEIAWSYVEMTNYDFAFNQADGIHSTPAVDRAKIMLMFNWHFNSRHNNELGTCCVPYPMPQWWQFVVMLILVISIIRKLAYQRILPHGLPTTKAEQSLQSWKAAPAMPYLLVGLALCFIADRTFVFHKEAIYLTRTSILQCCLVVPIVALILQRHIVSNKSSELRQSSSSPLLHDQLMGLLLLIWCIAGWCGEPSADSVLHRISSAYRQVTILSGLFILALRSANAYTQTHSPRGIFIQVLRMNLLAICLDLTLSPGHFNSKVIYLVTAALGFVHLLLLMQKALARLAGHTVATVVLGALQIVRPEFCMSLWGIVAPWRVDILNESMNVYLCFAALGFGVLFAALQEETSAISSAAYSDTHQSNATVFSPGIVMKTQLLCVIVNVWVQLGLSLYGETGSLGHIGIVHLYLVVVTAMTLQWTIKFPWLANVTRWLGQHIFELYLLHNHIWLASDGNSKLSLGLLQSISPLRRSGIPEVFDLAFTSILLCWLAGKVYRETKLFAVWIADELGNYGLRAFRQSQAHVVV